MGSECALTSTARVSDAELTQADGCESQPTRGASGHRAASTTSRWTRRTGDEAIVWFVTAAMPTPHKGERYAGRTQGKTGETRRYCDMEYQVCRAILMGNDCCS